LGYVSFSKAGAELLYIAINSVYERLSFILTSNLTIDLLTGALLDRITHCVHIIEANGENKRLNYAKKCRNGKV